MADMELLDAFWRDVELESTFAEYETELLMAWLGMEVRAAVGKGLVLYWVKGKRHGDEIELRAITGRTKADELRTKRVKSCYNSQVALSLYLELRAVGARVDRVSLLEVIDGIRKRREEVNRGYHT